MIEFERNIAYRREIFATRHADDDDVAGESVALEAERALPDKIYEILVIDECHSEPEEDECAWLVDAQKFMIRHQPLKQARAKRESVGRDCKSRPLHAHDWEPTSEGAEGIVKGALAYA